MNKRYQRLPSTMENAEPRLTIHVTAINDERVTYRYRYEGLWRHGCISRRLFDAEYREVPRQFAHQRGPRPQNNRPPMKKAA